MSQATELQQAYKVAQEIASKFNIPLPRIVVGNYPTAEYVDGVIHLPANLPPDFLTRVVAHEMAHHIHSYFGVPCNVPEAETFASMFEEAWVRMKQHGYNYPTMSCHVCGFKLFMYSNRVTCPKCKATYVYKYPSPGLGKAIGLGVLSGVGAYVLTTCFMKHSEMQHKPAEASALASGLIGFLAGLVL